VLRGWLHLLWFEASLVLGALMLSGGLLYTVGALSYHRRRPDPYPAVFGYHEVFHACVCAAAACQYTAIALFVTNRG
jgi:hemolysin III